MPLFALHALDKPGALELRLKNRAEHLSWVAGFTDKIAMAGPMFAEDGETFAGSLIVIEMDTLEDVKRWASKDPYAKAGLFGEVSIHPFNWSFGDGSTN